MSGKVGTYVAVRPTKDSLAKLKIWATLNNIDLDEDLHVTLLFSRVPVPIIPSIDTHTATPIGMDIYGGCLVVKLAAESLETRHLTFRNQGGTHDYDKINLHLTLQTCTSLRPQDVSPIGFSLELDREYATALIL